MKSAELKMVAFVAEHYLALSVLNHLLKLISSIRSGSEITKKSEVR